MSHETLPPIPTPPALRWREFRVRVLPLVMFVAAVGGVGFIWQRNLSAPMFVGAVEARSVSVTAPYAGRITQLHVDRFQTVTNGEPVAVLLPTDPRAALAVIQSELDILKTRLAPNQTQQRLETDYVQLRMDWLVQKVGLATAVVNLQGARTELSRQEESHKQKLISDAVYDSAVTYEAALAAEVFERSNVVSDAESGLHRLEAMGLVKPAGDFTDSLAAALQIEEQKLKAAAIATEPVILIAPIAGTVSMIHRQVGENIADSEPVLTIAATEPERIIAYLRQPVPFEPKLGATVAVRTRALQSQTSLGHIRNVGAQFEAVTNALAIARPGMVVDLGLPVEISLPPGMQVRPGEMVDLTLQAQD